MKQNGGFTLVELLVTIASSTLVIAAAMTVLFLGVRIQSTVQTEAGEQQTVRIVLTALEDLAASGKIGRIDRDGSNGWKLIGKSGTTLLQYADGVLCGASTDNILLENLKSAEITSLDGLVTFEFQTKNHTYNTSVYCRTGIEDERGSLAKALSRKTDGQLPTVVEESASRADSNDRAESTGPDTGLPTVSELSAAEKNERYALLQTLAGEYGSTGQIKGTSSYYSEWYIGGYESNPGWNKDTPWCACFLSWSAWQKQADLNKVPRFADVDEGMAKFRDGTYGAWGERGSYSPIPGDYIFFDWNGGSDPAHVGAVLYTENGLVYTIEGNSGGRVAVRSYRLNDPCIVGYGVLDWKK